MDNNDAVQTNCSGDDVCFSIDLNNFKSNWPLPRGSHGHFPGYWFAFHYIMPRMDHTSDVKPPLKKQHSSRIHQVMRFHVWSSLTCAFKFCLCSSSMSMSHLVAKLQGLEGSHQSKDHHTAWSFLAARGYEVNGSHRLMARAHLQSHIIDAYSCIAKTAKRLHSHAYSAVLILQNERVSLCWWIEVFEGFAPGWKSIDGTTPKGYSLARRSNRREWRHLP